MIKKLFSTLLCFYTVIFFASCAGAAEHTVINTNDEISIVLSDSNILVNGSEISSDSNDPVYVGAEIIYYKAGQGASYGEGAASDEHSEEEASAHTVVTITQPGTYRLSGKLSAGQIAVDLGNDAENDPDAVVTLVLDGIDITCTIAPAIIFYNVWESESTEVAGANVLIADDTVNTVYGSNVARIYQEGSTKKLHKYDGAFYSKKSMVIDGGEKGTGELHITAEFEGLDSELHLTINGGNIYITAQDDGINTNEDWLSVTTINGGYLYITGGLGQEGDGIDSNGSLVINGGTVITTADSRADGGLDADGDILLNGGTVIALGGRNDAVSAQSEQAYIELSYASIQKEGQLIRMEDADGNEVFIFEAPRDFQSLTYTSPDLVLDTVYYIYAGGSVSGVEAKDGLYEIGGVYAGGTLQQYTGTSSRMGGRGGFGGQPGNKSEMMPPQQENGQEFLELDGADRTFENNRLPQGGRNGGMEPPEDRQPPERPSGDEISIPPGRASEDGQNTASTRDHNMSGNSQSQAPNQTAVSGSTEFILTANSKSFSGVSDALSETEKIKVIFSIIDEEGASLGGPQLSAFTLSEIIAANAEGQTVPVPEEHIYISIMDDPSKDYAESCLLSEGLDAVNAALPVEPGNYLLTITVIPENETYTGTTQWRFTMPETGSPDTQDN